MKVKHKEVTAWIDSARDLGLIGCVAYDYFQKRLESVLKEKKPQASCLHCARRADNGGTYQDGRTRCPIEEHYVLPKDGHCHLYEPIEGKGNVPDNTEEDECEGCRNYNSTICFECSRNKADMYNKGAE